MKNKNILAGMVTVSLLFSSCQSMFNDANIQNNPNAVTDVDIPTLMSGTLVGLASINEGTDVRIASLWAQELAGLSRQHQGYAEYIVQASTFDWTIYYNVAYQARLIQNKADALGDKWTKGVGQVIEALVIAQVTDLYGDIPYSQAFDIVKYPTPAYDKQTDVYAQLISTLSSAATNLSAPTGLPFSAGDFIYGGNVANWKKVANTLQARLYLHLGNYPSAITSATAGIDNPGNDMLVPHGTSVGVDDNQNYDFFYVTRKGDTGENGALLPTIISARIASANTKTNETALYNFYFATGISATGSLDPNTNPGGAFQEAAPGPIITYYENQLILAEAYARSATPDLASALVALNSVRAGLANGILNGQTFSTTGNQYDPYVIGDFGPAGLANPKAYPDEQSAMLYEIITQRYIIFFMLYEAFNDTRRMAFATPVIQLGLTPVQGTQLPERFIYPQNELNTNPNTPNPLPSQFTKIPIYN
jgi:starch-binding outer membrane protein, SusD/RagB family